MQHHSSQFIVVGSPYAQGCVVAVLLLSWLSFHFGIAVRDAYVISRRWRAARRVRRELDGYLIITGTPPR